MWKFTFVQIPQMLLRWVGWKFSDRFQHDLFSNLLNTIFLLKQINFPISIKCTVNIEVVYKYM